MIFTTYRSILSYKILMYYKKRDLRIIMYHLIKNICGDEILKSAFFFQEKGVFLSSNVREKGEFSK